jgi:nickel-dependent lactate racemase
MEENPFYQEILRVAQMAKLDYSLNCVLNNQDQIAAVLFGSFKGVHEKGATLSKRLCGMKVNGKSDITIISAYPYEESLQVIKPLIIGSLITKLGGTVILVAKTRDEMPISFVELFEKIDTSSSGKLREYAIGRFHSNQLLLEGGAIDFNCALFFALLCKEKHRVAVVSRELGNQGMERMGFIPYEDLETALRREAIHQLRATVNILPLGGTTLPIMSEGLSFYD